MEKKFSVKFRKNFLNNLTKELVRNSNNREMMKLKNIVNSKKEGIPSQEVKKTEGIKPEDKPIQTSQSLPIFPKQPIKESSPMETQSIATQKPIQKPEEKELNFEQIFTKPIGQQPPTNSLIKPVTRQLFIPEPKLPAHLEYLKPIPTKNVDMDLWKLNPLIKDPAVKIIEVNPEEKVIVSGAMGTRPTDIILTKEDVNRVITKFSELSKIPYQGGIYRVVFGNLILSAIISDVVGSRFVIKKIAPPAQQYPTIPASNNPFQQKNIFPNQQLNRR